MKKLDKDFSENRWMMNPKSFYFTSKDGLSLFGRAWLSASSNPKGIVHLIHGLGEHSGRYDPIGKALMKAGYHLISFDLRGHGLSSGRRGDAPGIEFLLSDIQVFLQKSKALIGSILPRFLYGHSHGGVMVINFSLDYDYELDGVIVSSPVFCSTSPTSKIRTNFISLLSKIWPGFLIKSQLIPDALSRNSAIVKAFLDDVYVQDTLTARLRSEINLSGSRASARAKDWVLPLLLMHGTADQIASWEASRTFAEKAGDLVDLILWQGYYHELHHDLGSDQVIETMIYWMDEQLK